LVKNIIFDLGNVIIDLDIDRTWQQLAHWLGDDYQAVLKKINTQNDIFIDFEVGKIDEDTFFQTLRSATDTPLSIRHLKEAWNAMLLQLPKHRLDMLSRLKEKYNIYLLSNTNKTHVDWVDGYLRTVYGFAIQDFDARYFHKAYYSHLIHLRKPNVNCYEFVLQDAQIKAEETLFIDDNVDNIEGAKKVGIQTYLHKIGDEIAEVLKNKHIYD
jgi:glucose-1-phosphatase